jgi:uncharacterized protein (DUF1778 family)
MRCTGGMMRAMRSVHFRVSDDMYLLIQQGSEESGASVAHFCREAAIARAVLSESRRGHQWTDSEFWDQIMRQIELMDEHDTKLRAEAARRRRLGLDSAPSSQPAAPG